MFWLHQIGALPPIDKLVTFRDETVRVVLSTDWGLEAQLLVYRRKRSGKE